MRKAFQRRHGLAALSVFVGLLMAGGAAADRIKMLFPEPPMIGDPDGPDGAPRSSQAFVVSIEYQGAIPTIRVTPGPRVVRLLSKLERPLRSRGPQR